MCEVVERIRNKGIAIGIEKGRREGLSAGLKEGAHNKAVENARNFLIETDFPPEKIALCCSLSIEEVLQLKKEILERQH